MPGTPRHRRNVAGCLWVLSGLLIVIVILLIYTSHLYTVHLLK
jgi:hypothetical protein